MSDASMTKEQALADLALLADYRREHRGERDVERAFRFHVREAAALGASHREIAKAGRVIRRTVEALLAPPGPIERIKVEGAQRVKAESIERIKHDGPIERFRRGA